MVTHGHEAPVPQAAVEKQTNFFSGLVNDNNFCRYPSSLLSILEEMKRNIPAQTREQTTFTLRVH